MVINFVETEKWNFCIGYIETQVVKPIIETCNGDIQV